MYPITNEKAKPIIAPIRETEYMGHMSDNICTTGVITPEIMANNVKTNDTRPCNKPPAKPRLLGFIRVPPF